MDAIETTEQDGSKIYRKQFEMDNEQYARFLNLQPEPDEALDFWKEIGALMGFNPTLIEKVEKKGQKTHWKGMEYIAGTRRRKFSALSRNP